MGMTIDCVLRTEVTELLKQYYSNKSYTDEQKKVIYELSKDLQYFIHSVEAIPKADYENRLKADMVAMLTEIQLEIEEKEFLESSCSFMDKTEEKNYAVYTDDISKVIQQKIDAIEGKINNE